MPKSISIFEKLSLGSLLLCALQSTLLMNIMSLSGPQALAVSAFQVVILAILGGLVLLTSRKKSVICKWVLVVGFLFGLVGYIPVFSTMSEQGLAGVISLLQLGMQAVAMYFLFHSDSNAWFASKRAI